MKQFALCAVMVCAGLGACATTSFAPPAVKLAGGTPTLLKAAKDVDAFIDAYRDEANTASGGKALFDVPAIIAGIGGATAVALGANADVAIGTGAFGALATAGKMYYAPSEKADTFVDALSAFICIQQEVVGLNQTQDLAKKSAPASFSGSLQIDAEYRAYVTVKNAALKVENFARTRLATRGSVANAESIAELVKKYQAQIEAAKKAAADRAAASKAAGKTLDPDYQAYEIDLETLAPKLDACVLIAKG